MASSRRDRGPKPELGDSWVDADEGFDDSRILSQSEDVPLGNEAPRTRSERTRRVINTSSSHGTSRTSKSRRAHRPTASESELVMPSISELTALPDSSSTRSARRKSQGAGRKVHNDTSKVKKNKNSSQLASKGLGWVLDIIGTSLLLLKKPLAWLLTVWLLFGLMIVGRNLLYMSIYNALSPVCRIPGMTYLNFEMCKTTDGERVGVETVHFDKMMESQQRFEKILETTEQSIGIPADMKHSESSMRDLRAYIRNSQLRSRNELVLELGNYIDSASQLSWDLQSFDTRVGRAVDRVLSSTRWNLGLLRGIERQSSPRGTLETFFDKTLAKPFRPLRNTASDMVSQYVTHLVVVRNEVQHLVETAYGLVGSLEYLQARLDAIHEIGIRDKISTDVVREDLLASLWTLVGGNRKEIGAVNNRLKVLQSVDSYRLSALAKVMAIILELRKMGTELDGLQESIGDVEAEGGNGTPLEVQIETIAQGARRLDHRRNRQSQLEQSHNKALIGNRRRWVDSDAALYPEIEAK